ncbi:hypothetical protein H6B07_17480 [Mediterraneibacter glycyrrhizinilyticus]|uniref:hypothetical protein n=1 Tax=Mediterraneibacter glycyrrhizinilyticus TaxID=342942 RepID=UPI0019608A43|nr:hypothetical protein [Mediterraneibacter glycyrrhizinilyticus]MBM6804402.1 hypothetical protein [Mediterraneibacter glycyrrhizinilyticus]MDM8125704.1 hypothetical protein [Mediterraneibacter glycyrrhizinilyticus]
MTEGQTFHPVTASISEHYTTPPKPYSEDTLLPAMETAGNQGNSFSLPRMEPT